MDQIKIGRFLRTLRKEKNLTQEQLAEQLNVSGRTISRWETGSNMPDISLLAELAETFDVSIPELINGERKSEEMKEEIREETREVAQKMSDYAGAEKETILKNIKNLSLVGVCAVAGLCIIEMLGLTGKVPVEGILDKLHLYCETLSYVTVIMIFFHATGLLYRMQRKNRKSFLSDLPKPLLIVISAAAAFAAALLIKLVLKQIF